MSQAADELVRQARFLRNAAPQQFHDFCAAFNVYATDQLHVLLLATDDLAVAQGRAQQCHKLWMLLNEAENG